MSKRITAEELREAERIAESAVRIDSQLAISAAGWVELAAEDWDRLLEIVGVTDERVAGVRVRDLYRSLGDTRCVP